LTTKIFLPKATPATAPTPINLSMLERLIFNNTPVNAAFWTSDALAWHHALHSTPAWQQSLFHSLTQQPVPYSYQ